MPILTIRWTGFAVGKNRWHGARAIPNPGKRIPGRRWCPYIATIFLTKEYKAFMESIALIVRGKIAPLAGYYDIELRVRFWKMRDTSACLDPIQDSLREAGILDDRFVRNIFIYREYHAKGEKDSFELNLYKVEEDQLNLFNDDE